MSGRLKTLERQLRYLLVKHCRLPHSHKAQWANRRMHRTAILKHQLLQTATQLHCKADIQMCQWVHSTLARLRKRSSYRELQLVCIHRYLSCSDNLVCRELLQWTRIKE
jgi:hypothetical protein